MSTPNTSREAELARLRAATNRLAAHLQQSHGSAMRGSANERERRHMAAHRPEGTPWHDACQLDPADEPADADAEEDLR